MKKILAIIVGIITLLSLSSCMSKYSTIYCDFNIGNFDSAGYYILKNKQDIDKFKENHSLANDFVSKLESKDISLDDAVTYYQKGLELSKRCYEIFNQTQEIIVKKVEGNNVTDFNQE